MPMLLAIAGAILLLCVLLVALLIKRAPEGRENTRGFQAGPGADAVGQPEPSHATAPGVNGKATAAGAPVSGRK